MMAARRRSSSRGGSDWMVWVAIIVAVLFLTGGDPSTIGDIIKGNDTPDTSTQAPTKTLSPADIRAANENLKVVTVVPDGTSIEWPGRKEAFGPRWKDTDSNGCDTRNDILKRDLKNPVFRSGSNCVVESGVLDPEPYTGKKLVWTKAGEGIDIDHMVPLKRAWDMGASRWTFEERLKYANDPFVLLATESRANQQKGDRGPGQWVPQSASYHCTYVAHYVGVSAKYKLAITTGDQRVIESTLKECSS